MVKKITDTVVYIGCDDADLDLFESQFEVPNGMAYNSYAIMDEKVCIMDTVDKRTADAWLANVREALGDRKADYQKPSRSTISSIHSTSPTERSSSRKATPWNSAPIHSNSQWRPWCTGRR